MKQARIILEGTKVEIQAIEEYNQLKAVSIVFHLKTLTSL